MIHIVPYPNCLEETGGDAFHAQTGVAFDAPFQDAALTADFRRFLGKTGLPESAGCRVHITLTPDGTQSEEGYTLDIAGNHAEIRAKSEVGAFYALQSLKQLILSCGQTVPALHIEDAPRFPYRGFMLDVGRYFYSVEEVKCFLDRMALQKLNVFHWHLTEDQGWRIEIKKYPKLTAIGARRSHTNFGVRPHGGFYTQAEIREVVQYAHSLYIKVIPEIDMPGHMVSAIAAYPYLSCFDRKLDVATHWGVKHDILCAGKDTTLAFVHDVLDEVAQLFPDGVIHLGGDEAVKMRWKLCPHCQERMRSLGITSEDDLQLWFMTQAADYLDQKGIRTLMWNWDAPAPNGLLRKDIGYQLCGVNKQNADEIGRELETGRWAIQSSAYPYYLDFPYGWCNLRQTYDLEPAPQALSERARQNLYGVEAPLWTEYVPDMKKADYCTFPRLGAVAESGWTLAQNKDYQRFFSGLDDYYKALALYGVKSPASRAQAMPGFLRAKGYSLWFNRRQLHWQGLHNLIDDHKVKTLAAKLAGNK